jgi:hypothetical protein
MHFERPNIVPASRQRVPARGSANGPPSLECEHGRGRVGGGIQPDTKILQDASLAGQGVRSRVNRQV